MSFIPSEYSYGAETATPAAGGDLFTKVSGLLSQAAPALSVAQQLLGKSDLEKLAILKAKVSNYKKMRVTAPYSIVPGRLWYDNEISKMNAMISALTVESAQEQDTTADWASARTLTLVAGGVGVVVLATVGYYFVRKADK